MKKVFVSGGAGFVGSSLINVLVKSGLQIVSFDNLSRSSKPYIHNPNVQNIVGDIKNFNEVSEACSGCDTFFHLAASGNVIDSIKNPIANLESNVLGTLNCLRAASANNVNKFIFSSTGGALMGNTPPPVNEKSIPSPISPYGASKLACEGYCKAFSSSFGLHTTIFRFANVIGEFSEHKQGVINKFYTNLINDKELVIYGNPSRDFIYVGDLVKGLISGATANIDAAEIFHLCSGVETKISEVAEIMAKICGKQNFKIKFEDFRDGEVERTFASNQKASELLNFKCEYDIQAALERTINWFEIYKSV